MTFCLCAAYIIYARAACLVSVRSLSKSEFFDLPFGKRVQRYGLFKYWQNFRGTFFEKISVTPSRVDLHIFIYNICQQNFSPKMKMWQNFP